MDALLFAAEFTQFSVLRSNSLACVTRSNSMMCQTPYDLVLSLSVLDVYRPKHVSLHHPEKIAFLKHDMAVTSPATY
ncbi:MAG: hypothetical protein M9965_21350 [Anaerolineae bacterium]|nr:hypothetical protein [Anaerolineae bacterium]